MKTVEMARSDVLPLQRSRLADYMELTKPKIAVLVLFTVGAGFVLANRTAPDLLLLLHTVCGTALVAAGASVLNQYQERYSDALMRRTEQRPLPTGRLQSIEALMFGLLLGLGGLMYLFVMVQSLAAVLVAAFTFFSYVWIYTPLKRVTTLNTLIGAVPGALPPLIGWTAAGGRLSVEAVTLFLILFLWQVPHFLAIAWIYREDYGRAGLKMLPVMDAAGRITGRQMVLYCICLIAASLLPVLNGQLNWLYGAGALLAGAAFLYTTVRFVQRPSMPHARQVLRGSLLYLPITLVLLLVCSHI